MTVLDACDAPWLRMGKRHDYASRRGVYYRDRAPTKWYDRTRWVELHVRKHQGDQAIGQPGKRGPSKGAGLDTVVVAADASVDVSWFRLFQTRPGQFLRRDLRFFRTRHYLLCYQRNRYTMTGFCVQTAGAGASRLWLNAGIDMRRVKSEE
jgi:hypothetical protein